ncbi:MAG: hypothetical protein ICV77_09730 [Cyanobacteria bacterium Co-bin8]|nr:hypothetical protein [Cyanobacteria bacterium Co-bin8]
MLNDQSDDFNVAQILSDFLISLGVESDYAQQSAAILTAGEPWQPWDISILRQAWQQMRAHLRLDSPETAGLYSILLSPDALELTLHALSERYYSLEPGERQDATGQIYAYLLRVQNSKSEGMPPCDLTLDLQ